MVGNCPLSLSLKFQSIFVHISCYINPSSLIWVSLERSFPHLVKGDDIASGTNANANTGGKDVNGLIRRDFISPANSNNKQEFFLPSSS